MHHRDLESKVTLAVVLFILLITSVMTSGDKLGQVYAKKVSKKDELKPYLGVDVRGFHTSIQPARYPIAFPSDFYEKSFALITKAGMNHIRYAFYWEAYDKDPKAFMKELNTVAEIADKNNLKVIYDNHQYHTSSWLDSTNGTGFPSNLFDKTKYKHGAGGAPHDTAAEKWWNEWWNNKIKDNEGNSGWELQAQFLRRVTNTVDHHKSTLGYEILNEPQVHRSDQLAKVGKYNTFITNNLRQITNKTLVYSMNIPVHPSGSPKDIALMTPKDRDNLVFKFTIYDAPKPGSFEGNKLSTMLKVAKLSKVPVYIGEWNDASHKDMAKGKKGLVIHTKNNPDPKATNSIVKKLKNLNVWGWAYWNWNYVPHPVPSFNLVKIKNNGDVHTTQYFTNLEKVINKIY